MPPVAGAAAAGGAKRANARHSTIHMPGVPGDGPDRALSLQELKESFAKTPTEGNVNRKEAKVSEAEWDAIKMFVGLGSLEEAGHANSKRVDFVDRTEFDMTIGGVICCNALVIGLEYDLKPTTPVEIWVTLENIFCLIWVFEMVSKLHFWRWKYFKSPWNLLDFFLVNLSVADAWILPFVDTGGGGVDSLSVLKMLRILRILRLLRLVRLMKMFKNLWLIVSGFIESLSTLNWVLLLMMIIIYVFAVFLRMTIDCDDAFQEWKDCGEFFGTIPRSMYTLFQVITLESWSMSIGRPIFEIQPLLFVVFLLFLFLTTFGIMNIIVGVIVENTLNAAKQNEDLQTKRMQKQLVKDLDLLKAVFEAADEDASGTMELDEFLQIMKNADVRRTLTSMEIPTDQPQSLFEVMDENGTGSITFSDFTKGVMKVRGPPSSLDMKAMQVTIGGMSKRMGRVEALLEVLAGPKAARLPSASPSLRSLPRIDGSLPQRRMSLRSIGSLDTRVSPPEVPEVDEIDSELPGSVPGQDDETEPVLPGSCDSAPVEESFC